MSSTLLIMDGAAFLAVLLLGVGISLDTERRRTARRELARERRRKHEQRISELATGGHEWDDDD